MKTSIAFSSFLIGLVSFGNFCSAAVIPFSGSYILSPGDGAGNNVSSFNYNGAQIDFLTPSALSKVGITSTGSSGNFRGSNWPIGATDGSNSFSGSVDLGKYIEFSLAADPGYEFKMATITFGVGRSGTGPRQWEWRSSVDSFATPIATYTSVNSGLTLSSGILTNPDTNSSWTGNVLDLAGVSFTELTNITFRLYALNAEASGGTGGLQGNLTFTGEFTAVPEPATYALLLGGVALGFILWRRRRG